MSAVGAARAPLPGRASAWYAGQMRAPLTWITCAAALVLAPGARADTPLTLDGVVERGGLDHLRMPFEVPPGVAELYIEHTDDSDVDILDWGLDDPAGFRGWGGGNGEPVVVNAQAASRSYLAGPLTPGTWHVVIGKAKVTTATVGYRLRVVLRDTVTLLPQPERRPYAPAPALSRGPRWYAGDLHVHSRESGDAQPSLDTIATFARSAGLDFVALSDHNTTAQLDFIVDARARHPALLLVPSVEFTTYAGHANGVGATSWVDHKLGQPGVTAAGALAALRAQGALVSINHPLFDLGEACIGCAWRHPLSPGDVDAVELATAGAGALFIERTLAWWDALCAAGGHVAAVGGSDDHTAGERLGPFGAPIGTPTTYVYAEELSVAALLDGIRRGRTVVKLLGPTDPMAELTTEPALDGDTVRATRATLRARITGGAGLSARWVVDGVAGREEPLSADDTTLTREVTAPARARVEVLRSGLPTTITSHVWLRAPDAADGEGCGCASVARSPTNLPGLLVMVMSCLLATRFRRGGWGGHGRARTNDGVAPTAGSRSPRQTLYAGDGRGGR